MTSAYDLSGNKVIVGSGMSGLWLARLMADAGNTFCYPCNFTVDFRSVAFVSSGCSHYPLRLRYLLLECLS